MQTDNPPIQTTPFNINENVRVKLTAHGRWLHRKRHDELAASARMDLPYTPPKEDAEGWSRWQLWELMHIFGPHCYNGCHLPFETTILLEPQ